MNIYKAHNKRKTLVHHCNKINKSIQIIMDYLWCKSTCSSVPPPLDYARAVQIAAQLIQFRMVQRRLIAGNVHVDASSLFVYID